ncbi:GntR family transcriptional regulator [Aquamicrobium sp. LC103]|uniref:GntR family transcriptional regulator n=1 Tax=Aquamicrobium sp. LC103 TaxID=1120658 RepID=UPI00063E9D23|nr:GntR family transcriptional regulator [Aquamicrobium sp. LC103]TKT76318.1 GntR family transcriptional regulator [Aquamicrobium sp. LC103]
MTVSSDVSEQLASLSGLQSEIARKVLGLIGQGRWAPKEKVSDSALAREFGVSRTPVRQVLQVLTSQGLLEQTETRGFQLARILDDGESIGKIVPPSESESLYNRLMSARAAGKIPEEVSETELVEEFATTRGAIRRVLIRMSDEGLASRRAGHGWRFAECLVSKEAVDESYQFRLIIECGALLVPDYKPDSGQIKSLERDQRGILERPFRAISRTDWFSVNANFHETIVSWSGNRFLVQSLQRQNSLRRMTELTDFSRLSKTRLNEACKDHLGILEAIAGGDYKFAAALLHRHITRASQDEPDS